MKIIIIEDGDDLKSLERERFRANGAPSNATIFIDARDADCA